MSDLIERQAVIDAIGKVDWYHQNKNKDMVFGANSSEHQAWCKADDIYKTLDALPSVQPVTCAYWDRESNSWALYRPSAFECEVKAIVEAEPVRHGRWKSMDLTWGRSIYYCTNCGESAEVPTDMGKPIYMFCPHCGAKMDEENQNETN